MNINAEEVVIRGASWIASDAEAAEFGTLIEDDKYEKNYRFGAIDTLVQVLGEDVTNAAGRFGTKVAELVREVRPDWVTLVEDGEADSVIHFFPVNLEASLRVMLMGGDPIEVAEAFVSGLPADLPLTEEDFAV